MSQKVLHPSVSHVLQYLDSAHLPAHLREVVAPFAALAEKIAYAAPNSQETIVALRKLLESKDAAVRARLSSKELARMLTVGNNTHHCCQVVNEKESWCIFTMPGMR